MEGMSLHVGVLGCTFLLYTLHASVAHLSTNSNTHEKKERSRCGVCGSSHHDASRTFCGHVTRTRDKNEDEVNIEIEL